MSARDDYPFQWDKNWFVEMCDEIDRLRAQIAALEWPGPFTPDEVNEAET